jgi:hypothetical protein
MKKKGIFIILLIVLLPLFLLAQEDERKREKVVRAVRTAESIKIDGALSEKVWQGEGYSDFVQSDPIDGGKPTEKTVVFVAYDKEALYVAARMFDSEPEMIFNRLGRRDAYLESDWFEFSIDPYLDRRSGFSFCVNPAGSIQDIRIYNDGWEDSSWDSVWDWAAKIDDKGWTIEMRIPFNQLRFPKKESYIWGVNFARRIWRKNERDGFVWIPKEERGYVSHFARLVGVENIDPGRYIEFLPYAVGQLGFMPAEEGNPFETGKEHLGNVGLDFKMALKTNLILDATVNPDFGQVEVDPAVINLTAFETYYEEKRPFFIEGADIFNNFGKGGSTSDMNVSWSFPILFYSRRIGRYPQGDVSTDGYVNFPERTTILGAAKISGKIGNDWNIGFINAFTSREYAEIDEDGERSKEEVEPFSYYGILRMQKEFNEGRQGFGILNTYVIRDLRNDVLAEVLNKNSLSVGVDGWTFLDKNKTWVLNGWFGGSRVSGSKDAIYDIQTSSLHYFQRPDASHITLNENATSLTGWGGRIKLNREKGNFRLNASLGVLSPGFHITDAGFQFGSSDMINLHLAGGYTSYHPGKVFRNWYILPIVYRNYDFSGNRLNEGYLTIADFRFLNYWGFEVTAGYEVKSWNNKLTRGGPLALRPSSKVIELTGYSDSRKPVVLSVGGSYGVDNAGGVEWYGGISLRWKPRSNIEFSFGPGYSYCYDVAQWVRRVDDPLMSDTYGTRYVFGEIVQKTVSSEIRLNWTFTPRLSLQLYFQPFIAVGKYDHFKELARPRSYDFNEFGQDGSTISYDGEDYTVDPDGGGPAEAFNFSNPDFNYKSLRGTAVLRWEYRPGSVLYFVWTQNRSDEEYPGDFRFGRDFKRVFTAPGENIFLVKFTYRFTM